MNVLSTINRACTKETVWIWKLMYSTEPFYHEISHQSSMSITNTIRGVLTATKYDLVAAVNRQSFFFNKVKEQRMTFGMVLSSM